MPSAVVESATHLSAWILGMVAAIYFLQQFEAELKPLVLAFVFVSILEWIVQIFEWIQMLLWRFTRIMTWKVWQLLGLASLHCCRCCKSLSTLSHVDERQAMGEDILWDWQDLGESWKGSDAGRYALFRVVAVLITLTGVVVVSLQCKTLVEQQVHTVSGKLGLYGAQVTSMANFIETSLPDLQYSVPESFRNETRQAIEKFQVNFKETMDSLPAMAESVVPGLLNSIVSTFSSHIMDLVFFILYSAFMLFDPLHINVDAPASGHHSLDLVREKELANGWLKKVCKRVYAGLKAKISATRQNGNIREALLPSRSNLSAEQLREQPTQWLTKSYDDIEANCQDRAAVVAGSPEANSTPEGQKQSPNGNAEEGGMKIMEIQQMVYKIVWNYFMCMLILNVTFAGSVFGILTWLNVDLSSVQAGMTFFLAFIPELGALISLVLPIPFVLLTPTEHCPGFGVNPDPSIQDYGCIDDFGERLKKLGLAIIGMLLVKILVANVLNAILMGKNKVLAGDLAGVGCDVDDDCNRDCAETHGVLILFAVVFFSKVWGTVGMLISVPIISIARLTINIGLERGRQQKKNNEKKAMDRRYHRYSTWGDSPIRSDGERNSGWVTNILRRTGSIAGRERSS